MFLAIERMRIPDSATISVSSCTRVHPPQPGLDLDMGSQESSIRYSSNADSTDTSSKLAVCDSVCTHDASLSCLLVCCQAVSPAHTAEQLRSRVNIAAVQVSPTSHTLACTCLFRSEGSLRTLPPVCQFTILSLSGWHFISKNRSNCVCLYIQVCGGKVPR